MRFSLLQERSALFNCPRSAPIAQLVEQLICNQWVGGSSPSSGTIINGRLAERFNALVLKTSEGESLPRVRISPPPPLFLVQTHFYRIYVSFSASLT